MIRRLISTNFSLIPFNKDPPPFPFPLLPLQLRLEERDLLKGSFFMKHFLKIFAPAVLDALKVIK